MANQENGPMYWGGSGRNPYLPASSTSWGQSGGSAATTTPTTTGTPMYQQTNTQAPLGQQDYRTNIVGTDGNTFTANSDPSNASQFATNYLRPGLNMAQSYLNQGVGFNPYEGNRVAGFTDQQNQFFQQTGQQLGQTPGYMQSAQNSLQNVTGSGGMAPGVQGNLGTLDGIASGANGITTAGQFQDQANNPLSPMQQQAGQFYQGAQQGFGPSYSERNLADVAKGGGANPYFQDQLADQLDQIQSRINAQMGAAGRFGSGAYGDAMSRGLGSAATNALSRNYEFEAGRQMQANQLMDQQRQADIANRFTGAAGAANVGQNSIQNRMNALQGVTGVQGQNITNQGNAAVQGMQGRFNAQQDAMRAAALAPSMQQSTIQRLNSLMNSGTIQQSQNQDEINAARDLYNEQQQSPLERLSYYMGVTGASGGGNVLPQQSQPGPSTAQSVLGGALGGATIGNMFGMPGLGAIGGGLLGGLF